MHLEDLNDLNLKQTTSINSIISKITSIELLSDSMKDINDIISAYETLGSDIKHRQKEEVSAKRLETEAANKEVSIWGKITLGLFDSEDHKKHKELKKELEDMESYSQDLNSTYSSQDSQLKQLKSNIIDMMLEKTLKEDEEYIHSKAAFQALSTDRHYLDPIDDAKKLLSKADNVKYYIRDAFSEIQDAIYAEQRDMYTNDDEDGGYADRRAYWETEEANDAVRKVNDLMRELGDYGRGINTVSNSYYELFDFDMFDIQNLQNMENQLRDTERRLDDIVYKTKDSLKDIEREWEAKKAPFKSTIESKRNELLIKHNIM